MSSIYHSIFTYSLYTRIMYYTYILKCSDSTLYTGITTDIERRLKEHNGTMAWGAKYTKIRQPVELLYHEEYSNRSEASKRESEIKKMTREKKLQLISQK